MDQLESTKCRRCGRKLKNPQAIQLGMGSTCYRKWLNQDNHKKLFSVKERDTDESITM